MTERRALITGITGQDGSYLAELLLARGYLVAGLVRSSSRDFPSYIEQLRLDHRLRLFYSDIRDTQAALHAIAEFKPHEIYNLASQSHVGLSFISAEDTFAVNHIATRELINGALAIDATIRIYQASSSEMFGLATAPQTEDTPFNPVTPYGQSKLLAYQEAVCAPRAIGAYVASGILYNHESPRRGKNFVTRKITHSLAKIKSGLQDKLEIGNLDGTRDWGYAKDYVVAMWKILQQEKPEDFIIATGKTHAVRDVISIAATALALDITWEGSGIDERGIDANGSTIVSINPQFYRPVDVTNLVGDSSKARERLDWEPSVSFEELITLMALSDLTLVATHHE